MPRWPRRFLANATRAVLSPWVGAGALVLLVLDAVHVGRSYSWRSEYTTTAGGFIGSLMGRGGRSIGCPGALVMLFARTPRGEVVLYDRERQIREYAPNPPPGPVVVVMYEHWTRGGGFWAQTWVRERQSFSIYDSTTHAPLAQEDERCARELFADCLVAQGRDLNARANLARGTFNEKRVCWSGVVHTGGAGMLAVLTAALPLTAWRRVRDARRAAANACVTCRYSLVGLTASPSGAVVCPECGSAAMRRAA
jgi:hypothetical protein